LGLVDCSDNKSAVGMESLIDAILLKFQIKEDQIVGISCDRAAANIKYLRECAKEKFKVAVMLSCLCHAANSVLSKLKTSKFDQLLQKFRLSKRMEAFRTQLKASFNRSLHVALGVKIRWASTIPFANWVWGDRLIFREKMMEILRMKKFTKSANIININGLVNDTEKKWEDIQMEVLTHVEMEKVAKMIREVEGDGIRALSAFGIFSHLKNFELEVIQPLKGKCRALNISRLKDTVWKGVETYITGEFIEMGSRMEPAMNILEKN